MSAPPCCYHPTISTPATTTAAVTCCLCDSPERPCPAVTLTQRLAHEVYIGALEDGAA